MSLYSNVDPPLIVSLSVPVVSLYVIDDALIVLAVIVPAQLEVDQSIWRVDVEACSYMVACRDASVLDGCCVYP